MPNIQENNQKKNTDYNIQGATFSGGFAGRDYHGNVKNNTYHTIINYLFLLPNLLKFRKFFIVLAALLISLGIIFQWVRDDLSREFSKKGRQDYLNGNLKQAKRNYERAIALYSDAETHYLLGLIYEDLQEIELAIKEYQFAVEHDTTSTLIHRLNAYNNWGRLLIRQAKYQEGIELLVKGNNLINDGQVEINNELKKVKYALLKNLGWAQLEQGNLTEARSRLMSAIALDNEQGAAHCLMAKVNEQESHKIEAMKKWEDCLKFANIEIEEEYNWLIEAQAKFNGF